MPRDFLIWCGSKVNCVFLCANWLDIVIIGVKLRIVRSMGMLAQTLTFN